MDKRATLRLAFRELGYDHPVLVNRAVENIIVKLAEESNFEKSVEGKKFVNPETGNKVKFQSLPSKEQSKIRSEYKSKGQGAKSQVAQKPKTEKEVNQHFETASKEISKPSFKNKLKDGLKKFVNADDFSNFSKAFKAKDKEGMKKALPGIAKGVAKVVGTIAAVAGIGYESKNHVLQNALKSLGEGVEGFKKDWNDSIQKAIMKGYEDQYSANKNQGAYEENQHIKLIPQIVDQNWDDNEALFNPEKVKQFNLNQDEQDAVDADIDQNWGGNQTLFNTDKVKNFNFVQDENDQLDALVDEEFKRSQAEKNQRQKDWSQSYGSKPFSMPSLLGPAPQTKFNPSFSPSSKAASLYRSSYSRYAAEDFLDEITSKVQKLVADEATKMKDPKYRDQVQKKEKADMEKQLKDKQEVLKAMQDAAKKVIEKQQSKKK